MRIMMKIPGRSQSLRRDIYEVKAAIVAIKLVGRHWEELLREAYPRITSNHVACVSAGYAIEVISGRRSVLSGGSCPPGAPRLRLDFRPVAGQ